MEKNWIIIYLLKKDIKICSFFIFLPKVGDNMKKEDVNLEGFIQDKGYLFIHEAYFKKIDEHICEFIYINYFKNKIISDITYGYKVNYSIRLHKIDGPAFIRFNEKGESIRTLYYINNKQLSEMQFYVKIGSSDKESLTPSYHNLNF